MAAPWITQTIDEVVRQDEVWGDQADVGDLRWAAIALEEVLELLKAVLAGDDSREHGKHTERVQLMAILVRWWAADHA